MVPFSSTSFSRARSINSGLNGRRDEHAGHASVPSAREVPQTLQIRAPFVLTPGDGCPKQSLLRTSCQFLGRRQCSAAHLVSCLASYAPIKLYLGAQATRTKLTPLVPIEPTLFLLTAGSFNRSSRCWPQQNETEEIPRKAGADDQTTLWGTKVFQQSPITLRRA
jgi:hypothetical protein